LRTLVDKIGLDNNNTPSDLYETFVENFRLTGVVRIDYDFVDFDRFRQVYLLNKMNILDIIDLISGVF